MGLTPFKLVLMANCFSDDNFLEALHESGLWNIGLHRLRGTAEKRRLEAVFQGFVGRRESLMVVYLRGWFLGTKRIWPRRDDLGFFHWRTGKTISKDSQNYKVVVTWLPSIWFSCLVNYCQSILLFSYFWQNLETIFRVGIYHRSKGLGDFGV